jgi:hypothetical protein
MLHKKHFTLPEAENMLPEIAIKLSKIVELKKALDADGYDIYKHVYFGGIGTNGSGQYPGELVELITFVDELTKQGIQVKSIDEGLIDFPHIRKNGEEVYLCYLLGENDIQYWHRIEDGFKGRKGIDEL